MRAAIIKRLAEIIKRKFDGGLTSVHMTRITTRQIRRRQSRQLGEMLIEHTYVDQPASLETWVDHCTALATEFGISALDVHRALFAQLPEIFGR